YVCGVSPVCMLTPDSSRTILPTPTPPRCPASLLGLGGGPSRRDRPLLRASWLTVLHAALRRLLCRKAGLEGLHQIDDLSLRGRRRRDRDFLARYLALDQLEHPLAVFVFVFLRVERWRGQLLDQLDRQIELAGFQR